MLISGTLTIYGCQFTTTDLIRHCTLFQLHHASPEPRAHRETTYAKGYVDDVCCGFFSATAHWGGVVQGQELENPSILLITERYLSPDGRRGPSILPSIVGYLLWRHIHQANYGGAVPLLHQQARKPCAQPSQNDRDHLISPDQEIYAWSLFSSGLVPSLR